MPTEMGAEAVEIITMSVDKFQTKKNYEVRTFQEIKSGGCPKVTTRTCTLFSISQMTLILIIFQQGAAQLIKNTMDKKFGATWHCVIGEGFGFDVTCQRKFLLHVFYGHAGVLCYKC